ncbi:MAG: glycosyltransferase family 2 protein [Clostridia bacterium]|nr:glycosyltransferase family 2 protein [Clostridia bacterium]
MIDTVVLIPAYKPDHKLIETLQKLSEARYTLLVVDDGSGTDYDSVFIEAARYARVVRYTPNRGKGSALKRGMRCVLRCFPNVSYLITADADGQHRPADIQKVCDRLHEKGGFVIGSRAFVGEVPLRSRFGNTVTRGVYRLVSGVKVQDTQTGLRGFDRSLLDWLIKIPGERYEYEMNVLMTAARDGIAIDEVAIETVYENDNSSSHFRPLQDSVKIYKEIFRFALFDR